MSFSSIRRFLNVKNDGQLNSIITSLSCVVIKAQLATSNELVPLVEFANGLKMKSKYLVIGVPIIQNYTALQHLTMNYNAMIYHNGIIILNFILETIS